MGLIGSSLIFSTEGVLPIKFLSTKGLISFCDAYEALDVDYTCASFAGTVKINKIFNVGKKDLIKITTACGFSLCGSNDQLVLVGNTWVKLGDIKINDGCTLYARNLFQSSSQFSSAIKLEEGISLDHIMEVSKEEQLAYVKKLNFNNLTLNSEEMEQLHVLLLSLGMVSDLNENKSISNIEQINNCITLKTVSKEIVSGEEYKVQVENNDPLIVNGFAVLGIT